VGVFVLAGLLVTAVGVYVAIRATGGAGGGDRDLLPYQALVSTLPEADQRVFGALRQGLLAAETARASASRWPDVAALAAQGVPPFAPTADEAADYRWERLEEGVTIDYEGRPVDPSRPAWLLTIQEPEPGSLPDPAPNDEQHHRLPDGTVLHVYVWMHRYGGQVPAGFVPQPQNSGWTEMFAVPPSPILSVGR
jgi:hypothetical protein